MSGIASGSIPITTASTIAGRSVSETLGLVRGNTIRARHLGATSSPA